MNYALTKVVYTNKTRQGGTMKIGQYKVEDIGDGDFKISYEVHFHTEPSRIRSTIICGGDFETILSTLFIGNQIMREMNK